MVLKKTEKLPNATAFALLFLLLSWKPCQGVQSRNKSPWTLTFFRILLASLKTTRPSVSFYLSLTFFSGVRWALLQDISEFPVRSHESSYEFRACFTLQRIGYSGVGNHWCWKLTTHAGLRHGQEMTMPKTKSPQSAMQRSCFNLEKHHVPR